MSRPNRKRLSMDMPIEMHAMLKKIAHKHNVPLTMYILRIMDQVIKKEQQYE